MANRLYNEDSIRDIASAIREKNGTSNTYSVAEMGGAIRGIQTSDGGITPTGTIEITTNGTHDVTQYASASVNVPTESGGGSNLPSNVRIGVLTLEENVTTSVTITHGCGSIPQTITIFSLDKITGGRATAGGLNTEGAVVGLSCNDAEGSKTLSLSVNPITNITENTFDFTARAASYPLMGGYSYLWVAIA